MGFNETPSGNRIHISIFGKRNAGKSSIINAITGQNLAIVSDIKGTTTDPVSKAMELLPLGPVVITDTPGLDDDSILGAERIEKTMTVMRKTDLAMVVIDSVAGKSKEDLEIIDRLKEKQIPYVIVYNKADLSEAKIPDTFEQNEIYVSAEKGTNIFELKECLGRLLPQASRGKAFPIIADKINPGDFVVLVIPIDEAAPKGRLILPQQQTIREILEMGAVAVTCQDTELSQVLKSIGKKPKLVITDSQAFHSVNKDTPSDMLLTSFSILFARHKGSLPALLDGVKALENLADGDCILISEGCTHHRQCNDIGSVKLPRVITGYSGKQLSFDFTSGGEFPDDLSKYKLIVHCGGCMLNEREMKHRMKTAKEKGVPITNYGMVIACVNGILERSLEIFKS